MEEDPAISSGGSHLTHSESEATFSWIGPRLSAAEEQPAPCWWARAPEKWRARRAWAAGWLESVAMHLFIVGLVLLDLLILFTEMSLRESYPEGCDGGEDGVPEAVRTAEDVFFVMTVSILSIMALEQVLKLAVFGFAYFYRSVWHLLDVLVIVTSLALELSLKNADSSNAAGALAFLRLWRVVRVAHCVGETAHEQVRRQRREAKEWRRKAEGLAAELEAARAEAGHAASGGG